MLFRSIDAAQDPKRLKSLKDLAKRRGLPFFKISSVTGEGVDELKRAMADQALPSEDVPHSE